MKILDNFNFLGNASQTTDELVKETHKKQRIFFSINLEMLKMRLKKAE